MSWETVRSLDCMLPLVLIIRKLCTQGGAPEEVMENLEMYDDPDVDDPAEIWDL